MAVVLVIDAYDGFREAMEYCLPKFGHVALSAPDGATGLRLAQEGGVDLVLVDMDFPLGRGVQTCAAIKRDSRLKELPVVLMLDRVTPEMVVRTRSIGVDAVIPKPFEWSDFMALLARLCPAPARDPAGC